MISAGTTPSGTETARSLSTSVPRYACRLSNSGSSTPAAAPALIGKLNQVYIPRPAVDCYALFLLGIDMGRHRHWKDIRTEQVADPYPDVTIHRGSNDGIEGLGPWRPRRRPSIKFSRSCWIHVSILVGWGKNEYNVWLFSLLKSGSEAFLSVSFCASRKWR